MSRDEIIAIAEAYLNGLPKKDLAPSVSFSRPDRRRSCCCYAATLVRLYNHLLGSEWNSELKSRSVR